MKPTRNIPKPPPLAIAFCLALFLSACAKSPPTLLSRLDDPGMSREQLRAQLYDFVLRYAGQVESAAYSINTLSGDLTIARDAVLWLSASVSAVQSAAFQPDPAAGMIDVWALCLQQFQFFKQGTGRGQFGDWHPLAVDASRQVLQELDSIARVVTGPADYDGLRADVESWASTRPLESVLMTRESTAPLTAAALGSYPSGAFAAVGNLEDEVRDLSARVSVYTALLPKQVRWQAALLMSAEAGGVSYTGLLHNIEQHAAVMQRLSAFMDSVPALIDTERAAVMNDITAERLAVIRDLQLMMDRLTTVALEAIDQERLAVMEGITLERIATLEAVDALATRVTDMAVDRVMQRANGIIDYFWWRAVQVLAIFGALLGVAGFFAVRMIMKRLDRARGPVNA